MYMYESCHANFNLIYKYTTDKNKSETRDYGKHRTFIITCKTIKADIPKKSISPIKEAGVPLVKKYAHFTKLF